jgi:hypothetical protein
MHHHTELPFVDEFRWVSPLHYLKNGWQNTVLCWCMLQAGAPSVHYYRAVLLHSCILLTPVGHSSNHEYHCCQLTRQLSSVPNFIALLRVSVDSASYVDLHVKCPLLLSSFAQNQVWTHILVKPPKMKFYENPSLVCLPVPCGRIDVTKLMVAVRSCLRTRLKSRLWNHGALCVCVCVCLFVSACPFVFTKFDTTRKRRVFYLFMYTFLVVLTRQEKRRTALCDAAYQWP